MHETVIARNIIQEAEKHGNVRNIFLEIGELGPVPPHELIECLRELVKWEINPRIIKAEVKCKCGFRGHPKILERGHDSFFIECPRCKKVPELVDGKDIKITKVIVD